jgi:hypothetical protein
MDRIDPIPFSVDLDAVLARLKVTRDAEFADDVAAVVERASQAARPKAIYEIAYVEGRNGDAIRLAGQTFTSRVLCANLASVERVFFYIVTCGHELDELGVPATDFIGQYALDTAKEMALHAAAKALAGHLERRHGLTRYASMNPGAGDADVWPIQQQRELFAVFGDVRALLGVTLLDTFLMLPNKTISGLYYPTAIDFKTCQLCHRPDCPNRRAVFDQHLWESMHP